MPHVSATTYSSATRLQPGRLALPPPTFDHTHIHTASYHASARNGDRSRDKYQQLPFGFLSYGLLYIEWTCHEKARHRGTSGNWKSRGLAACT